MNSLHLKEKAEMILDQLWDLKDKCYGEDSNDMFDDLHDDIYYQCEGFGITYDELMDDLEGNSKICYETWDKSLEKDKEMVDQIQAYYEAVTKAPEINWIYG